MKAKQYSFKGVCNMKKILCFLLCSSLLLFAVACNNNTADISSDKGNNSQTTDKTTDLSTLPGVSELYTFYSDQRSFLLVEFDSFGPTVKSQIDKTNDEYLLVNFEIVEDFCEKIDAEKIITVPFSLETIDDYMVETFAIIDAYNSDIEKTVNCSCTIDSVAENNSTDLSDNRGSPEVRKKYYSVADVKEFISTTNRMILYLDFMLYPTTLYPTNYTELFTTAKGLKVSPLTNEVHLSNKNLFLVEKNDVVNQNKLMDLVNKNNVSLEKYCDIFYDFNAFYFDGISVAEFKKNIKNLYAKQTQSIKNTFEGV